MTSAVDSQLSIYLPVFSAVLCSDPPTVTNGNLMVDLNSYHYGDYVEYTCHLGYEMSGSSLLTCDESGLWDQNAPQCNRRYPVKCVI